MWRNESGFLLVTVLGEGIGVTVGVAVDVDIALGAGVGQRALQRHHADWANAAAAVPGTKSGAIIKLIQQSVWSQKDENVKCQEAKRELIRLHKELK